MAAGMLAEKLPATIPPLGQGWHCDQAIATLEEYQENLQLVQAQEVTIQSRVGDPEIAFGL